MRPHDSHVPKTGTAGRVLGVGSSFGTAPSWMHSKVWSRFWLHARHPALVPSSAANYLNGLCPRVDLPFGFGPCISEGATLLNTGCAVQPLSPLLCVGWAFVPYAQTSNRQHRAFCIVGPLDCNAYCLSFFSVTFYSTLFSRGWV